MIGKNIIAMIIFLIIFSLKFFAYQMNRKKFLLN